MCSKKVLVDNKLHEISCKTDSCPKEEFQVSLSFLKVIRKRVKKSFLEFQYLIFVRRGHILI